MKHRPEATFLMPDMRSGLPPADAENSRIRWPRIRRVTADHNPLELQDGDPALDDLIELVGKDGMMEFGEFLDGGFRMIEMLGLIDDPADQLPDYIVEDLKPHVPVLPMESTRVKLVANGLAALALRGLGATICGPYEEEVFLHPTKITTDLQVLAWKLLEIPGIEDVLEGGVWWAEVPEILFDIHDPDKHWECYIPPPSFVVDLFVSRY